MKHSQVRQHIVETASELFYQRGYNLTGINEIIREAGIAKATLYSHFPSKEDICIAYLRYKNTGFLADLKAFALKQPDGNSQVMAVFDFLELFFKSEDFNGCWCINTVSELPKDNERVREEIKQQKQAFIDVIDFLIAENLQAYDEQERLQLARQIYLLYEGAISESHLHRDSWPIMAGKKMCRQLLP